MFGEAAAERVSQHDQERMEQELTREVMGAEDDEDEETLSVGGIRLIPGNGLNVFDTMGLEGIVVSPSFRDVSSVPASAVTMSGLPAGSFSAKAEKGGGKLDAHKAALKIRERRSKKGRGSRGPVMDASRGDVNINMRLLEKAIRPDIEEFHRNHSYEHSQKGRAETDERQTREASEALRELHALTEM